MSGFSSDLFLTKISFVLAQKQLPLHIKMLLFKLLHFCFLTIEVSKYSLACLKLQIQAVVEFINTIAIQSQGLPYHISMQTALCCQMTSIPS